MSDNRYDVIYGPESWYRGPYIEHHFCREWENGEGCYGTNPNHGFTFEEARQEVIKWWQNLTEERFTFDPEGVDEKATP